MKDNYTSVCDTCGRRTWYDKEQKCHCKYPLTKTCDTCGHTETIEPIKEIPCTGTLRLIDNSDLDSGLTPYYESGERVEITWKKGFEDYSGYGSRTKGQKARYYIGRSTGWKPIYLGLLSKNSHGGISILTKAIESLKGLGTFKN